VRAADPPVYRSPGTGVFLNANRDTTPLALRALYEHTRVLPESVVIVSIETLKVPHHPPDDRCMIDDLGYGDDGISHVTARFGFQDETHVPATLWLAAEKGLESDVDLEHPSYFLSQIRIHPTDAPGMAMWRKKLFIAISRNSASPVEYFKLPDERTVTMGSQIEL
jgi:KUP system potassium uptake protein